MKLIARCLQIDSAALPHFPTCGSPVRTAESINKTSQHPSRKCSCKLKSKTADYKRNLIFKRQQKIFLLYILEI